MIVIRPPPVCLTADNDDYFSLQDPRERHEPFGLAKQGQPAEELVDDQVEQAK
jgi:hypothetical protein